MSSNSDFDLVSKCHQTNKIEHVFSSSKCKFQGVKKFAWVVANAIKRSNYF